METPYPSLTEQVQDWKDSQLLRIPSRLNIKGGVLAGGAVARTVFDRSWKLKDYDIFVPMLPEEERDEYSTKRIKVEYDSVTLDLVFKANDISDFDLSVCQVGINLDTNEVFATPLFLYSVKRNVMICRISNFGVGYLQEYEQPVSWLFNVHVNAGHIAYFCYCIICKEELEKYGDEVFVNDDYKTSIDIWFERVKKYHDRFPTYKLHFVDYE
jgi:hypothetical protein